MKRRTCQVESARALAPLVADLVGEPSGLAAERVRAGGVYVDGRRCRNPDASVPAGAVVSIVLEERGVASGARPAPPPALVVLYEDAELLVVDKPPGVVTQPTPGATGSSLADSAAAHVGRPVGLVHRLDRETSGVLIFGKSRDATSALAGAFREGAARKRYLAVTAPGLPAEGLVIAALSRDPTRPGRFRATARANGVPARTRYARLGVVEPGGECLVALFPETGRTHQLRAHLVHEGAPIVGDRLYGGVNGPRCLLHAQALELLGRRFEAPVPADLLDYFERAKVLPPRGPICAPPSSA